MTDLRAVSIEQLEEAVRETPCPLALVVLVNQSHGEVLFGLNTWRREYELPGGIIEEGESPRDAAARELQEETGIAAASLTLVGYARFSMAAPPREELGAIYAADGTGQQAHPSDELETFVWREPLSGTELKVSAIDDAIAAWVIRQRPAG